MVSTDSCQCTWSPLRLFAQFQQFLETDPPNSQAMQNQDTITSTSAPTLRYTFKPNLTSIPTKNWRHNQPQLTSWLHHPGLPNLQAVCPAAISWNQNQLHQCTQPNATSHCSAQWEFGWIWGGDGGGIFPTFASANNGGGTVMHAIAFLGVIGEGVWPRGGLKSSTQTTKVKPPYRLLS